MLQRKLPNKIELCNEMLIQSVSVHMFLFTDFILDEGTKFVIGFVMVAFIGLLLGFNLIFILFFGFKSLTLIYRKYKNLFVDKFLEESSESDNEFSQEVS